MGAVTGRRGRRTGRDVTRLLADFGHDVPTVPATVKHVKQARLFTPAPRAGARRRGRGWAPARAPVASVADDQ